MVGAAVFARYEGKKVEYKGEITKVHRNGTFDVKYDDGDFESVRYKRPHPRGIALPVAV